MEANIPIMAENGIRKPSSNKIEDNTKESDFISLDFYYSLILKCKTSKIWMTSFIPWLDRKWKQKF